MLLRTSLAIAMLNFPLLAAAAEPTTQNLRDELNALRQTYETRIADLEKRIQKAETQTAAAPAAPATPAKAGARQNLPDISLILSGGYSKLSRDPASYRINGFELPEESGPGSRGFALGETELGLSGNIDPNFYGSATLAFESSEGVGVEEAYVQTTSLPMGFTLKGGRFFSGIGYLNSQHAHSWDFVDTPLAYRASLGGQYGDDGLQLKWLAPTDMFLEFGAELSRGRSFPGTDTDRNGADARALFAHIGGDVGASNSWRAGLSWLSTQARDRESEVEDLGGNTVNNSFSGRHQIWAADFVWKWAPQGNGSRTNFIVQGEYLQGRQRGELTYDSDGAATQDGMRNRQSGWYLQALYQFMPRWRAGLRYDSLNSGSPDYGLNNASLSQERFKPSRETALVEWKPSEFSRLRLQLARDKSRHQETDNQIMLQYQMSLGAHGAHAY